MGDRQSSRRRRMGPSLTREYKREHKASPDTYRSNGIFDLQVKIYSATAHCSAFANDEAQLQPISVRVA